MCSKSVSLTKTIAARVASNFEIGHKKWAQWPCFSYLVSFGWKADGMWKYKSNKEQEEFGFQVPMPDGHTVSIDHLGVGEARETLGVPACLSGDSAATFEKMQKDADKWIGRVKESNLGRRDI